MASFNVGITPISVCVAGAYSSSAASLSPAKLTGVTPVRDMQYAGTGTITGTVHVKGTPSNVPVARKVRLIRDVDAVCIREVWSDAVTGVYAFTEIDSTVSYTVLSYDYTESFRAVVADRVLPA